MSPNINESMTLDEVMKLNQLREEYKSIPASSSVGIKSFLEYMQSTNESYNQIKKYIMIEEVKCFRENNTLLFEGITNTSGVFGKMLELFLTFIERVKDAFVNVWRFVSEKLEDADVVNKAFLIKYKKHLAQIQKIDNFEGYDFSRLDSFDIKFYIPQEREFKLEPKSDALPPTFLYEQKKKILNTILNGTALYATASAAPEKAFQRRFYGNENMTKKTQSYDIKEQVQYISSTHRDYKTAQINFNKIDTTLKGYIIFCKARLAAAEKDPNTNKFVNDVSKNFITFMEVVKYSMECNKLVYDLYCKAIIDRNRQAKAICIKAMQENPYHENAVEAPKYGIGQLSLNDIYQSLS